MVEGQSVSPKGKNSLCWRAQGGIGKPRLESVFSRVLPDMDASVHERMLVTSSHERLHICRIDENTRLIWIKFPLVCGGYREMFGYERELDSMIITSLS